MTGRINSEGCSLMRRHQWLLPVVAFEITSQFVAYRDIWGHSKLSTKQRLGWSLVCLVQPIGPWLYYLFVAKKATN